MFSGIVEELGSLKRISRHGNITLLEITAEETLAEVKKGDSLAVNGVCLTVVEIKPGALSFEIMPLTLGATNLGALKIGEKVNLERSLKVGDRISGHFVLGHIDCLGIIRAKNYSGGNLIFKISLAPGFMKYCLPKGSVAIDGISLTIAESRADSLSVGIIPHTLKNTTLNFKGPSAKVNIEFDLLAKRNA